MEPHPGAAEEAAGVAAPATAPAASTPMAVDPPVVDTTPPTVQPTSPAATDEKTQIQPPTPTATANEDTATDITAMNVPSTTSPLATTVGSAMVVPGNPEAAAAAASSASYIAVKAEVLAKHAAAVTQLQELYYDKVREQYFLQHGGSLLDFAATGDLTAARDADPILKLHLETRGKLSSPTVPSPTARRKSTDIAKEPRPSKPTTPLPGPTRVGTRRTSTTASSEAQQLLGSMLASSARASSKREQEVLDRIKELKAQGLWSQSRLPKLAEPSRHKMHWDYLLEEMSWLSNDFVAERKWKKALAKKVVRAVVKWHETKATKEARELRAELLRKKKVAANIAREATKFWKQMLQVVGYKQKVELDAVKKDALEQHLDFIVGQTAQYTKDLQAKRSKPKPKALLAPAAAATATSAAMEVEGGAAASAEAGPAVDSELLPKSTEEAASAAEAEQAAKDADFVPDLAAKDDESSLAQADEPVDAAKELDELAGEADLSVEALLAMYPGYGEADDADGEDDADDNSASGDEDAEDSDSPPASRKRRRGSDDATAGSARPSRRTRSTPSAEAAAADEPSEEAVDGVEAESDGDEDESVDEGTEAEGEASTAELLSPEVDPEKKFEIKAEKAGKLQPPDNVHVNNPNIKTRVPYLIKGTLRPYQHVGLDWLANMCDRKLNGILADEMGLGKTIQTIALLAHLAVEKGNWGPHLIIVPTSVMLNWEIELKKFCPAFKVLTYYGSVQKRKEMRKGWSKPNAFHVCITSYKLAVQDHQAFRRKKWKFMILDEAHQIKNFESKRWQTLLGFQSRRRLLLTGTPLQNNLMELWSLMHFLMPKIFQSHAQFKEWFGAPVAEMVEGRSTKTKEQQMRDQERVHRLHTLLRPFLLRRLKKDVETQLPGKTEHVIKCSLSKRQRQLYDDFMSRSNTKASLRGGNYLTVVNVLMQLRKVCNHPNLFQEPVVQSPFLLEPLQCTFPALVLSAFENDPLTGVRDARRANPDTLSLALHNLCFLHHELNGGQKPDEGAAAAVAPLITALPLSVGGEQSGDFFGAATAADPASVHPLVAAVLAHKEQAQRAVLERHAQVNVQRSSAGALFGQRLLDMLTIYQEPQYTDMHDHFDIFDLIVDFETRTQEMAPLIARFSVFVPTVTSSFVEPWFAGNRFRLSDRTIQREIDTVRGLALTEQHSTQRRTLLHTALDAPRFQFPDRRLIQYDCGKLQTLERLLREKRVGAHRVLVFTQMSKMLDILEQFLNYHAFTYLRLDGSTPITERQRLMDRFNMDKRIFVFILSTRSGGVGVNLTGADTVVFYDSDWNPTMDAQAQDRCHRIGQTREVNIYRLISERTVEENILKKAQQKRMLGDLAIESGDFNTDFFNVADFFDDETLGDDDAEVGDEAGPAAVAEPDAVSQAEMAAAMSKAEDESDRMAAEAVSKEVLLDAQEFDEAQPFPDDPKYATSTSEGEGATEDELQVNLKAQLDALQGIEKHALSVLQRYLEPAHQTRLEQARQAILEKDQQLKDLEAKIKEQEELESEDDDELFYDKDEAYAAYVDEALKGQKVYAPPNPNAPEEVYVEPAHAMQYRVGYLAFAPLPKHDRQKRFRKTRHGDKRPSNKRKYADGVENRYGKPHDGADQKSRRPLSSSQRYTGGSLFRRPEKDKQPMRHPIKRPLRMLPGKEKREVDSNKDAPSWVVDEDYALWQIVRTYLNPNGTINWHLVADAFNTSVSFTGRYRSTNQCRDRYFRTIMPREEGKEVDDSDDQPSSKKRKEKHANGGVLPVKVKAKAPATTNRLREMDNGKSLLSFHQACFTAAQQVAVLHRGKLTKGTERHGSHETILQSITFPPTGPFTPAQLSQRRIEKDKQLKEQQQAGQDQRGAGAAGSSAARAGAKARAHSLSNMPADAVATALPAGGVAARLAGAAPPSGNPGWPPAGVATAAPVAAAAAAAAAAPGVQPTRSAAELAQLALTHFKRQESRVLIYSIYNNPDLDEGTKVAKLTAVINSLNQQYKAQRQAAALAAQQAAPGGAAAATSTSPSTARLTTTHTPTFSQSPGFGSPPPPGQ